MFLKPCALTIRAIGIANVLKSQVAVSLPFIGDPSDQHELKQAIFEGIWDTGATNCMITPKIVATLGLVPISKAEVNTAGGKKTCNVYLVNITLPSNVTIQNVRVTEADEIAGTDMLIGMDIINLGDFSITNIDNKTVMSFRLPSCTEIDYVKDINKSLLPRAERRRLDREELKNKTKLL